MYDQLAFDCKELIISNQHGFSQKKSTVTNLLVYEEYLLKALEDKCQVDSVYTDFSKAFDRVHHGVLIKKLRKIGFNENLIQWLQSFLIGRKQIVKVGSFNSNEIEVWSGVPQGSHCSPLLFNLFINDIDSCFQNSKFLMFADDLKFYRVVNCIKDQNLLQADLNNLIEWCEANRLYLNMNKCSFINFYKVNKKFDSQ